MAAIGSVILCCVLTAAAVHTTMAVAERMGWWLSEGPLSAPPFDRPLHSRRKMKKFAEQSWQLVVHVTMTALEVRVLHRGSDWLQEGWRSVDPAPYHQTNGPEMKQLYFAQLAVWIYTAFCQLFVFEKQRDYFVMMTHHIATIGLVGLSYQYNYVRYGVLVLFLHDIADIVIDLMKIANYLKLEGPAGFFVVEFLFVTNLFTWIYFRLYVFAVKVIWGGTLSWVFWFWPGSMDDGRNQIAAQCLLRAPTWNKW